MSKTIKLTEMEIGDTAWFRGGIVELREGKSDKSLYFLGGDDTDAKTLVIDVNLEKVSVEVLFPTENN